MAAEVRGDAEKLEANLAAAARLWPRSSPRSSARPPAAAPTRRSKPPTPDRAPPRTRHQGRTPLAHALRPSLSTSSPSCRLSRPESQLLAVAQSRRARAGDPPEKTRRESVQRRDHLAPLSRRPSRGDRRSRRSPDAVLHPEVVGELRLQIGDPSHPGGALPRQRTRRSRRSSNRRRRGRRRGGGRAGRWRNRWCGGDGRASQFLRQLRQKIRCLERRPLPDARG